MLTGRWTRLPGGLLYARASLSPPPAAPVVALVHGLVVSSRYLLPTAARLAPRCEVQAPDLPGFGRSYKPWLVLDLAQLADALAQWLDALVIPCAHWIGNSFGCQVLAEFALRHPRRVERLVLLSPTVDPGARSYGRQLSRLLRDTLREPPTLGGILLRDLAAMGVQRAWATAALALADRIEDKLPLIQAPTLVVRGGNDPVVPQRWATHAARLLPHGELAVLPGRGHALNYNAPEALVRLLRPFLGL